MNLDVLEVIALLFPEPSRAREGSVQSVLALVRDEQGLMEIKSLRPDVALIKRARVTGRVNCGTPILDPDHPRSDGLRDRPDHAARGLTPS